MIYAFAISLLVNVVLVVLFVRRTRLWHCRMRFWFLKKPDFAAVEGRAKEILAEPEFAEWLEFMQFVRREWMADMDVRHKKQIIGANWKVIESLARRISEASGLPCWPYRMVFDADKPALITGSGFGIGYSTCGCTKQTNPKTEQPAVAETQPRPVDP